LFWWKEKKKNRWERIDRRTTKQTCQRREGERERGKEKEGNKKGAGRKKLALSVGREAIKNKEISIACVPRSKTKGEGEKKQILPSWCRRCHERFEECSVHRGART
jgi:hypothetical protein